jgi:hypothetical protein
MKRMAMTVAVLVLIVLVSSTCFAQNVWRTPCRTPQVEFIANLYLDTTGLVSIDQPRMNNFRSVRYVKTTPLTLPEQWNLSETRVGPDGQIIVSGYRALQVTAGIRLWNPAQQVWSEISWSAEDRSPGFAPEGRVFYATNNTPWSGNKWQVQWFSPAELRGGAYYTSDFEVISADVNLVTDEVALIEGQWVSGIGSQRRIVHLDPAGTVIPTPGLGWMNTDQMSNIRWSPTGDSVMYVKDESLYETDLTGYGSLVEANIDCWTWLPDGVGYAVGRVQPFSVPFKGADARTIVSVHPARGLPSAFAVLGRIWAMDARFK